MAVVSSRQKTDSLFSLLCSSLHKYLCLFCPSPLAATVSKTDTEDAVAADFEWLR